MNSTKLLWETRVFGEEELELLGVLEDVERIIRVGI